METVEKLRSLIDTHRQEILDDYFTFLSYPSISSEPEHKESVEACANWLMDYLQRIGFSVEKWPTAGHPTVFASYIKAGPDKPTLLIYNHYDVQPVDPEELWNSPPFNPTIKEGHVYARGAQDNKGQCFYVIQALKLFLEAYGSFPLNIKLCIEGEEEIGSAGLSKILKQKKEELKADYLAIVDLGLKDHHIPALTLGIRGIVTMDVEVTGSHHDLHSGAQGGIVPNPIHALVQLLASLRDVKGRITIPGFYDAVVPLSAEERAQLSLNFEANDYYKETGATPVGGEKDFSALERAWTRPTLEINGISGGYTGKGFKTVIPAKAYAKISCRLVANQDPHQIGDLVAKHLMTQAPAGVKVEVHVRPGVGKAVKISPSAKVVKAFAQAFEEVFKAPCEFILEGGSIPVVSELAEISGGETILLGLGLHSDLIHAPNEHFGLDRLEKGILIIARALELL